jgi:hypothetical protein
MLRWQHPFEIENPNWHRSEPLLRECEWKQGDSAVVNWEERANTAPPVGRRFESTSDTTKKNFLRRRELEVHSASRWSALRWYSRTDKKRLLLTTTAFSWKPRPLGSGWMSQYIRDEDGHRFALVLDDVPDRFLNILILP